MDFMLANLSLLLHSYYNITNNIYLLEEGGRISSFIYDTKNVDFQNVRNKAKKAKKNHIISI